MAIENARRITRESSFESPTVRRFVGQQSLPARVRRGRVNLEAANDNEQIVARQAANDDFLTISGAEARGIETLAKRGSTAARKSFVGLELWIASGCAFFQFFFGILALVFITGGQYDLFFGMSADDLVAFMGSTVGAVALGAVNFAGSFFGFHLDVPPMTFTGIGYICWGLTLLFTIGGYGAIAFTLWLQGVHAFGSIGKTLMTLSALTLDIIIVTQLFPWMVVWVIVVHFGSLMEGGEGG